jgi:acyl carrier protein
MVDIEKKVRQMIVEKTAVSESKLLPETRFTEDLKIDSMDVVELIVEFENEFDINIPSSQAEEIKTLAQAVECITRKVETKKLETDL